MNILALLLKCNKQAKMTASRCFDFHCCCSCSTYTKVVAQNERIRARKKCAVDGEWRQTLNYYYRLEMLCKV